MPRQSTPLSELGSLYIHHDECCAHLQFRDEPGVQRNIYGPNCTTHEQAQKDLEQIRKPAEKAETSEKGLEMMQTEAQKLKDSAKYETEIRDTFRQRDSLMENSDYEDDDMTDDSESPWIQECTEELPNHKPIVLI